jgi:ABC-type transport system substrate-binding protein
VPNPWPSRDGVAVRVAAVAALGATLVGACTGDDGGALRRATTTVVDEPVSGGALRIGIEPVASLDPSLVSPASASALLMADLLFDGLTASTAAGDVVPGLAGSWTPTEDLLAWRFVLRPDARFSSGVPVTATDVKFSFDRVARQGDVSLAAARLDVVVGYADLISGSAAELSGVRVVDDATVEIATTEPFADLPALLAAPPFGVVSRADAEGDPAGFGADPVGSGPFRLAPTAAIGSSSSTTSTTADDGSEDGQASGEAVRLVRATGGAALLDAIVVHQYDDLSQAYEEFVAGALDVVLVPPGQVDDAAARFGDDHFEPFGAELFYGFNLASPKFADARFRQAIVRAIDRASLVRAVYGSAALPLAGVVPAGVPGGHVVDPCDGGCSFDVAAARSLVQAAFPAGDVPEVQLDYYVSSQEEAVAGIIESSLEAVGIPAARRPRPFEEYQQFAVSGEQELFRLGWIGIYPSAGAYLQPLFRSDGLDNATGFADATVDGLLATARSSLDVSARGSAYRQAERTVMGLVPIVPLLQFETHIVAAERVQDLDVSVLGTFAGEQVWLAP